MKAPIGSVATTSGRLWERPNPGKSMAVTGPMEAKTSHVGRNAQMLSGQGLRRTIGFPLARPPVAYRILRPSIVVYFNSPRRESASSDPGAVFAACVIV